MPTDFANILFSGPCNRRCYYCIGERLPARVNGSNLDLYPLRNQAGFVEEVNRRGIRQIVFTGTVSDPQLYKHQATLLADLRATLTTSPQFSIHTNGALTLRQLDVFNLYDRACLSFPSFNPDTYEKHMGSRSVPDVAAIVAASKIPVKVSCVLDEHNASEVPDFLARCHDAGIKRLVFRKQFEDPRSWSPCEGLEERSRYRGNPVYDYRGMEVTYWDFDVSESTSINLFSDGTIGTSYLLTDSPELRKTA